MGTTPITYSGQWSDDAIVLLKQVNASEANSQDAESVEGRASST